MFSPYNNHISVLCILAETFQGISKIWFTCIPLHILGHDYLFIKHGDWNKIYEFIKFMK